MLMVLNGGSMERKQESFQLYTTTAVVLEVCSGRVRK